MAIRNIVKKGDEILNKNCKPVTEFNEKLWALLDDMHETLRDSNGAGLAAPQVGIIRRIALILIEDGEPYLELINPVIIKKSGRQREIEGCLSCPNVFGYVKRPKKCVVKAQNRNGEFFEVSLSDLSCRAACHEIDHLNGHLFTELVDEYVDPDEME
ncbi:MAG: peptide deformylase [Oscillospiraceae bacterium]|nr:peptide deformylase [Oscillospiraceae bacterium]MBR6696342.1 peptide deformylase [Oscillospiraceae bacterium]